MKTLKIWNGRGHGKVNGKRLLNTHFYVAAYSVADAVRLINEVTESHITAWEINHFYSKGCWGNPMDGIEPTEPCLYYSEKYGDTPKRIDK